VHLVSIHPELNDDNQLGLKMLVAGDSRDRAIELVRRMEDSRRFAQTYIVHESLSPSANGDTEQFEIAAFYIPEMLAPVTSEGKTATPTPKSESKKKTEAKPKTPKASQH
jgi:hypothetical protein